MRRALLTLAILATIALTASPAPAAHGYGGYPPAPRYGGYAVAPGYGMSYQRHYDPWAGRDLSFSYEAGVQRIMAAHSRYRYNPHPRSFYKSPPHPYDYWGW